MFKIIYEKKAKRKQITVRKTEVVNEFRSSRGSFFSDEMEAVLIIIYVALLGLFLARDNFSFAQVLVRTETSINSFTPWKVRIFSQRNFWLCSFQTLFFLHCKYSWCWASKHTVPWRIWTALSGPDIR